MKRIGIAASKISRGNLIVYNLSVIFISMLLSLLVFFISSFSILLVFFLAGLVIQGLAGRSMDFGGSIRMCLIALSVVIGMFSLLAVFKNFKVKI